MSTVCDSVQLQEIKTMFNNTSPPHFCWKILATKKRKKETKGEGSADVFSIHEQLPLVAAEVG